MLATQEVGTTFEQLPNGALLFNPENGVSALQLAEQIARYMWETQGIRIDVFACEADLLSPDGDLLTVNTTPFDIAQYFNDQRVTEGIPAGAMAAVGDSQCVEQRPPLVEPIYVAAPVVVVAVLWLARALYKRTLGRPIPGVVTQFAEPPSARDDYDWEAWFKTGKEQ